MSADQALSEPMAMDDELLLKSLLCVAESLEDLLGPNGARVMLRAAGRKPAANLIGDLPLRLIGGGGRGAFSRPAGELGFAKHAPWMRREMSALSGLPIKRAKNELGLGADGSGRYFCIGSLEGFSQPDVDG